MKKFAFSAIVLIVAAIGSAAEHVTVQLKYRSMYDLINYAASDRFPLKQGVAVLAKQGSNEVDVSGDSDNVKAAVAAISAWDVRPDLFEVHFGWQQPGAYEQRPILRTVARQAAKIRFGQGDQSTGFEITPWYGMQVSFALGFDSNGRRFTTVLSGEHVVLTFAEGKKGKPVVQISTDGKSAGETELGGEWADLVGSTLTVDTSLIQQDPKP